jgi:ABC-2 type transport system ATP-binding protein
MTLVIETHNLSKTYGDVTAVDRLSLRVAQGEIYAFLGLNGAGKTTTIRMLLGMIRSDAGSVTMLGTPIRGGSVVPWGEVGYLVETPHAYPELTVRENLEVARRLHPGTPRRAIDNIIEKLSLTQYADRRAGTLSLGNAQRLGLAKALLHDPKLLILDEPANGLDPAGIVEIRDLLHSLTREHGVTVFMSSHILGEVSKLADRIGIIHRGRLLQELDRDEMERNRRRHLLIQARNLDAARAALGSAGYRPRIEGTTLTLDDARSIACPDEIATLLVNSGTPPTRLMLDEEDLEAYFLRLVGVDNEVHHELAT